MSGEDVSLNAAVERRVQQVIADAWGDDDDKVLVLLRSQAEDRLVKNHLSADEARAFGAALVAAADSVDSPRGADGPDEPPAPRGDGTVLAASRRTQSGAKTPQSGASVDQMLSAHEPLCTRDGDHGERDCSW